MCGIVGGWTTRWIPECTDAALDALRHRGPDGQGEYADGPIWLGHTRLAIIDLSPSGHQPMLSDDGQVVLVYNGEIYNYRELRAELEAEGIHFRGTSDSEVLLRLYLARGLELLPALNGIFAFALYDRRSGDLFLARDEMGVKPLYVSAKEQQFVFASEIKALLPWIDAPGSLDEISLHRYLTFLWCPGAGTPYREVRKLGPGEAICVRQGRVVRQWIWSRRLIARPPNQKWSKRGSLVATLRDELRQAVRRQLVADVPVGAFLSGGLDSSALVALAQEAGAELRCFTVEPTGGSDAGETEDGPYAQRVAAHLGVPLERVPVDAHRMMTDLEWMIWQLDEPLADPAALNVFYIARLARQSGIKVLLSGAGADDLFAGYRRHLALRYADLWLRLPEALRRLSGTLADRIDRRGALGRRLERLRTVTGETGDARLAAYFAWVRRDDLWAFYTPRMREAVGAIRADQPMLDFLELAPPGTDPLTRMLALEQRFFLADHNLIYTDKMGMAAGVEIRVPFLDPQVVDFAAHLPARWKQHGRVGKWILKQAMEPYLPRDVINRPKTGFGAPLRRWMRKDLHEYLTDLLSMESLGRRGLFEPMAVHRLIADNDAGRRDAAYLLFSLLSIEIWCRKFIDRGMRAATGADRTDGVRT
ncbi:MAG: asparagine synthase (glutamine-hydrolyzing) [Gammaproteobacteria bacterium]